MARSIKCSSKRKTCYENIVFKLTCKRHSVFHWLDHRRSSTNVSNHSMDDLEGMLSDFVLLLVKCLSMLRLAFDGNCPDYLAPDRVKIHPYCFHLKAMCLVSVLVVKSVPFVPLVMDPTLKFQNKTKIQLIKPNQLNLTESVRF